MSGFRADNRARVDRFWTLDGDLFPPRLWLEIELQNRTWSSLWFGSVHGGLRADFLREL